MGSIGNSAYRSTLQFIFDSAKPFMAIYCSFGTALYVREMVVCGRILLPRDNSTTYVHGYAGLGQQVDQQYGTVTIQSVYEGRYYGGNSGTAGYRALFSAAGGTSLTNKSAIRNDSPPTAPEIRIALYDNDEQFGYLDPDVIRTVGAYPSMYNLITERGGTDLNLTIKFHNQFSFPWVKNMPILMPDYRPGYDVPPKALWGV